MAEVDEFPSGPAPSSSPGEPVTVEPESRRPSEPSRRIQPTVPEPLPPFVFPMRPSMPPAAASSSSTSSSGAAGPEAGAGAANVGGRPPPSADASAPPPPSLHARRRSVVPLPAFDFRPGQSAARGPSDPAVGPTTPTSGPSPPLLPPPRSGGHRRGGSEFIGGDGIAGVGGLMSSSPTKRDGGALPLPRTAPPPGRSEGRRGHAHRRSGAISCHDLSVIARPSSAAAPAHRAESAPTSPMEAYVFPRPESRPDAAATDDDDDDDDDTAVSPQSLPEAYPSRPRVDFADSVEIIPRPLSPLSSDASSGHTTIPGLDSKAGSISSVLSGGSSLGGEGAGGSPPMGEDERSRRRPTTAGAVMTRRGSAEERPFGDVASVPKRPTTASYCANLRASVTGAGIVSGEVSSPIRTTEVGSWSPSPPTPGPGPAGNPIVTGSDSAIHVLERAGVSTRDFVLALGRKKSSDKKTTKNSKKPAARRSPTPPPHAPTRALSPSIDFDSHTGVIVSPNFRFTAPPPSDAAGQGRSAHGSSLDHVGSSTPVIDLDALLGPFDPPQGGLPARGGAHDGFHGAKRRMHSFGGTGGFRGPGMDYHRRSESAPELVSRSSLHRLRNSSIMADVFEEDEEDVEETRPAKDAVDPAPEMMELEKVGMATPVGDSHSVDHVQVTNAKVDTPRAGSPSSDDNRILGHAKVDAGTAGQLIDEGEQSTNNFVGDVETSTPDVEAMQADQAIVDPAVEDLRRERMNIVLPSPDPEEHVAIETPALTMSSAASPDFGISAFEPPSVRTPSLRTPSGQTPSVFTARSSMTEERAMPPALMRESSFDLRKSVDDVPSLASDHSTMASALQGSAHPPSRPYSNDGGIPGVTVRSGSFASHTTGLSSPGNSRPTTAKRSSLISLSKLVGNSRGEKSKLSIAQSARADSPEKATTAKATTAKVTTAKEKRATRFSRLMSFWTSKQARGSAAEPRNFSG